MWTCILVSACVTSTPAGTTAPFFSCTHRQVGSSNDGCTHPASVQFRPDLSTSGRCVSRNEVSREECSKKSIENLRIDELGEPMHWLSESVPQRAWHALLCQTNLAADILPSLLGQPITLLRRGSVDFTWGGTVVWFRVASRFGWLGVRRTRFLGLYHRIIRLLF